MESEVHSTILITPVDQFRFCREEIKHEYNVVGGRLTSYITSQSFLFTTYGVSMSNSNDKWGHIFRLVFPLIVCTVGLLTSWRANPGIASACQILDRLHNRQLELYRHPEVCQLDPTDPQWMRDIHTKSLWFSDATTYIFGGAWIVLIALALYVYTHSR